MSEPEYLDPDSVIKANHTPIFQATQPKYRAEETPPPYVLDDTPESSPESLAGSGRSSGRDKRAAGKRRPRRQGRTRPSQCDAVLIGQLDPNQPEIAAHAGEHALDSGSQSEADDPGSEGEDDCASDRESMLGVQHGEFVATHTVAIKMASEALKFQTVREIDMPDRPESPQHDERDGKVEYEQTAQDSRPSTAVTEPPSPALKLEKKFDLKPPPRLPPISTTIPSPRRSLGEEDSIATSPALAKFITQGNPDNILPKMQNSPPPRSTSAHSPEASGPTLPSLKTALSMSETSSNGISYHSATSAHSPAMTRPSPGQHMPGYGPSPVSYTHPSPSTNGMSPPSIPTHRSYGSWGPPHRDGSQSTTTPSEYASNHSHSTPSSAITQPSPANSYSTPMSTHHRQDSEGTAHVNGNSPIINGNGTSAAHIFKCNYQGCTAAPFQTQYLLNSHTNVHSQSRPHFCPVPGCNRGPNGKGFKRKNEMIRYVFSFPLHCLIILPSIIINN